MIYKVWILCDFSFFFTWNQDTTLWELLRNTFFYMQWQLILVFYMMLYNYSAAGQQKFVFFVKLSSESHCLRTAKGIPANSVNENPRCSRNMGWNSIVCIINCIKSTTTCYEELMVSNTTCGALIKTNISFLFTHLKNPMQVWENILVEHIPDPKKHKIWYSCFFQDNCISDWSPRFYPGLKCLVVFVSTYNDHDVVSILRRSSIKVNS